MVDGVGGLQRGDEALGARQELEGLECLDVRDGGVLCPPAILEPRVLGPDPRIVQPRGNGVCFRDLTIVVLGAGGGDGDDAGEGEGAGGGHMREKQDITHVRRALQTTYAYDASEQVGISEALLFKKARLLVSKTPSVAHGRVRAWKGEKQGKILKEKNKTAKRNESILSATRTPASANERTNARTHLQEVGASPVQHPRAALGQRRRVERVHPLAAGLDAH